MAKDIFAPRVIERRLPSAASKILVLGAVIVPGLFLAAEAARIGMAAMIGDSMRPADLKRAIAMESADPAPHERLGLLETYSFDGDSGPAGIQELRRAVTLSPWDAQYWANLAMGCESVGEVDCANQAVKRTLALSPMTPRYRWMAANYYLLQNQVSLALEQFRRLITLDSTYAWPAFQACLKVTGDPNEIAQEVVPADNPPIELAYINFLAARGDDSTAAKVWNRVSAGRRVFPFGLAEPYLDHLIAAGHDGQAVSVWQALQRSGVIKTPVLAEPGNLVFNGSFEQTPLNGGFDWRYGPQPYLMLSFGDGEAYQGRRSLRLDFTVSKNRDYEAAYQVVPVAPNQAYQLSAYAQSLDITSDSGPCLRVTDPECPSCLDVQTGNTVGTTPWHQIGLNFLTGPQTRLVRLALWRGRSFTFPPQITGSFWLDDVSLKAVQPPGQQASAKR